MKNQNNTVISLSTYLASFFWRYKLYISSLILIGICAATLYVSVNYKIKEIIDTIAANSGENVGSLIAIFVFFKLSRHLLYFIARLLDMKYKPVMLVEIVSDMYTKTLVHSLHWFDSHLSGEISSKIIDFQNIVITIITMCFRAFINVAVVLISLLFLWNVSHISAAVIAVFILIYTPIISILLRKQMQLQEQYTSARQETVGIVNDSIANIFGIKIIGNMWSEFKLKLTPSLMRWSDWDRKTRFFDAWFVDNADTIMGTIMSAVQIYVLRSSIPNRSNNGWRICFYCHDHHFYPC